MTSKRIPERQRVKEAVSEVKKVARRDPALAAEGAVMFLERVSAELVAVNHRGSMPQGGAP